MNQSRRKAPDKKPGELYFTYSHIFGNEERKNFNPFSAGTAFMLMQTGWIQASRRVTRRLA